MTSAMASETQAVPRFRNRRDAERVIAEIISDGGAASEYRIEQDEDGSCVILILDSTTSEVAGVLGA